MSAEHVQDEPEVSLDAPFGLRATVRGRSLIAALSGIAFVGSFFYFLWAHNQEMEAENARLGQKLDELVYVSSLSPEKREQLNLSMPESLRVKRRSWRGEGQ